MGHADEGRVEAPLAPPPGYYALEHVGRGQTCNYLSLCRPHSVIREAFTIGPDKRIPKSTLPPLGRG